MREPEICKQERTTCYEDQKTTFSGLAMQKSSRCHEKQPPLERRAAFSFILSFYRADFE